MSKIRKSAQHKIHLMEDEISRERQDAWLLIKEKDEFVRPAAEFSVIDEMPDSVKGLSNPKAAKEAGKYKRMPSAKGVTRRQQVRLH